MLADLPPPFICTVAAVTDADTIRCADGTRVRIAGINAREKDGSCRPGAPCPAMRHAQAQPIVERLTLHKRLSCQPVDRSFKRIVATCRLPSGADLSCAIIASGAALRWESYWRRYRMGVCRG